MRSSPSQNLDQNQLGLLSHLALQDMASSAQNQILCAPALFIHRTVPHRDPVQPIDVAWIKKPKMLPVVLMQKEVKATPTGLEGDKWPKENLLYAHIFASEPRVPSQSVSTFGSHNLYLWNIYPGNSHG